MQRLEKARNRKEERLEAYENRVEMVKEEMDIKLEEDSEMEMKAERRKSKGRSMMRVYVL